MLEEGALEEVKNLNKIKATGGVLKAIGVSEIKSFLNNEIDKETMIDKAVTATTQYAKRQMTWFRHHGVPQHVITNPNEIEIKNITK